MAGSGEKADASRVALLAAWVAALLIAQQVGAKTARDTLFLSRFDATHLPSVVAATALVGIGAALVAGRFLSRFGPARCVPWLFGLQALFFGLEYLAARDFPNRVAVVLYLQVGSLGGVLASAFWSAVNEHFDPYTAKRVISRIGAGATLGGVVGGIAIERTSGMIATESLLLVFAVINLTAASGSVLLGAAGGPAERVAPLHPASALQVMRRTRYLRDLALLLGLLAIVDSGLDYVFKAEATSALGKGGDLLRFFALFYTATALLTFVVQAAFSHRVLARLGLGGAVAALPGGIVLTGIVAAAVPGLWSVGLLRATASIIESSLFRSGYELLYTPTPPADKRATKALLDVAVVRLGTIVGSGLVLTALMLGPSLAHRALLIGGIAAGMVVLGIALRLHRGYVAALARNLRTGAIHLDRNRLVDSTTLRTLTASTMDLDRMDLLRRVESLQNRAEEPSFGEPHANPRAAMIDGLCGNDPARARAVLAQPLPPELIGLALPWLARNDVAPVAERALEGHVDRHAGQLIDALLDSELPTALRRRLPRLLSTSSSERVQRGLFAALADPLLAVRKRAVAALHRIQTRTGGMHTEEDVLEAVRRELGHQREANSIGEADQDTVEAAREQLELIFGLLGLSFERQAIGVCTSAILGSDSRLRGTALEYLDNVLPPDIRDGLFTRLRAARDSQLPKRARDTIVRDLVSEDALGRVDKPLDA